MKRIGYIDYTKGILIFLVVIGHIWQGGTIHNIIYTFHMPAFFVISGMLMSNTESYLMPFLKFLRRKSFSYGIPFLFAEALGILTEIMRNGLLLNWKGYIGNTLSLNHNDPELWFLVTLFLVETLFSISKHFIKNDYLLVFGSVIICLIINTANPYITAVQTALMWFPYFVIGFHFRCVLDKNNVIISIVSFLVCIGVGIQFGRRVGGISVENIPYFISGICGTYAVLQIGKILVKLDCKYFGLVKSAGKNSIIVFNTHRFYYTAVGLMIGIRGFNSTPLGKGLLILAAVFLLEIPTIYGINRWAPFLSGKRRKVKDVK